jgi:hypothetical protein
MSVKFALRGGLRAAEPKRAAVRSAKLATGTSAETCDRC